MALQDVSERALHLKSEKVEYVEYQGGDGGQLQKEKKTFVLEYPAPSVLGDGREVTPEVRVTLECIDVEGSYVLPPNGAGVYRVDFSAGMMIGLVTDDQTGLDTAFEATIGGAALSRVAQATITQGANALVSSDITPTVGLENNQIVVAFEAPDTESLEAGAATLQLSGEDGEVSNEYEVTLVA